MADLPEDVLEGIGVVGNVRLAGQRLGRGSALGPESRIAGNTAEVDVEDELVVGERGVNVAMLVAQLEVRLTPAGRIRVALDVRRRLGNGPAPDVDGFGRPFGSI